MQSTCPASVRGIAAACGYHVRPLKSGGMRRVNLPDYPFEPLRFDRGDGIEMSYLDEGTGPAVVMVHGNPTWSYYYRHLVLALRGSHRCIVPDHVGMGLSDKPDDSRYRYTLDSRIDDLDRLLAAVEPERPVTLVLHDWGGLIGLGWALRHPQRVVRLVLANTAGFTMPADKRLPGLLKLGRDSSLGSLLIRGFNAFSAGATRLAVKKPMPAAERRAFTAPYDSWANRIATLRFVQDIPLGPKDPAWATVAEIGRRLPEFADRPALLLWGMQDFVFDHTCLREFRRAWPQAEAHEYAGAGHYVLEDARAEVVAAVKGFLAAHPPER
jgi:cis-3-alkyl-4-acyloxetan-2-one decarboxylase